MITRADLAALLSVSGANCNGCTAAVSLFGQMRTAGCRRPPSPKASYKLRRRIALQDCTFFPLGISQPTLAEPDWGARIALQCKNQPPAISSAQAAAATLPAQLPIELIGPGLSSYHQITHTLLSLPRASLDTVHGQSGGP